MNSIPFVSTGLRSFLIIGTVLFSGCTISQHVVSAPAGTSIDSVYVESNPAVLMDGLVGEIEKQVTSLGFTASVYKGERPKEAVHYLKYTANWRWDMAMYLTYFQATLYEDGRVLGTAEYDARSGGANMGKFGHTGEKIRPILAELFKNVGHAKLNATPMGTAP